MRYAAENGYDALTWTTGAQQADRYDLSKQVGKIEYEPSNELLRVFDKEGHDILMRGGVKPEGLEEYIGKEPAQRLIDAPLNKPEGSALPRDWRIEKVPQTLAHGADYVRFQHERVGEPGMGVFVVEVNPGETSYDAANRRWQNYLVERNRAASLHTSPWQELTGDGLKIGGEGMAGFYDKILPDFARKYGKKWGATVGTTTIQAGEQAKRFRTIAEILIEDYGVERNFATENEVTTAWEQKHREDASASEPALATVHSINITPAMRESVMQGQPLFQRDRAKVKPAPTAHGAPHAADYRHGVVWVGEETILELGRMMGTTDAAGFYSPPMASRDLLQKLEGDQNWARVADAVRAAIADSRHHGSIIIVSNERGRGLANLKATVRHERFHQAMGNLMGAARGQIFLRHPLAQLAADNLSERYDRGDDATMWAEIGAHLAAGPLHWDRMGLDRDQAKELFREYLKLLDDATIKKIEHASPLLNEVLYGERAIGQVRRAGVAPDEETEGSPGQRNVRSGVRPSVPASEARSGETVTAKLKRLAGDETAAINIAPLSAEVRRAADTVAKGMLAGKRSLQIIFTPGALAHDTSLTLRARTGELARASAIASKALESAYNLFESMPVDQRWDFYDRVETGRPQTNGALNVIANTMRLLLDHSRDEVRGLGTGKLEGFIVNYLPHAYKDPQRAEQMFAEFYAKAPYEGKKAFLKRRKYETLKDAMDAGLEPISDNPVDLILLKIREMQKYVMAHRVMQDEKNAGRLERGFAANKPAGRSDWIRIDDKIGTIYGPPEITVQQPAVLQSAVGQVGGMLPGNQPPGAQFMGTSPVQVNVPGIRIMGYWYGPADSVRLINNYLSPGLRGNPLFRSYLTVSNAMIQFQLGFSAFHLGFTTMDATISKGALAIYQASHGNFAKAGKSVALTPLELFGVPIAVLAKVAEKAGMRGAWDAAAPLSGVIRGDKILRGYYRPGSQGAQLATIVNAMVSAGGRAELDQFYKTQLTKQLIHAVKHAGLLSRIIQSSVGGAIGGLAFGPVGAAVGGTLGAAAALRAPFALAEQAARPIMNYVVPRQKMAVFADLAQYELERFSEGAISDTELRTALAAAWQSVDNRMGQLVYDNLFWNKVVKDLGMASLRTVGWQVGTVGEVGGGLADILKLEPPRKVNGVWTWDPKVSLRLSYILSAVVTVGAIGAVIHFLLTGERPEELKDLYFPRSGKRGTPGWNRRLNTPSYIKDVVHLWTKGPIDTVKGKVNSLLSLIWEMLGNEDFFGKPIAVRGDDWYKNLERETLFGLESFEPFTLKPPPKSIGPDSTRDKILRFGGFTPAPAYIQGTAKERKVKPHEAHF